MGEERKASECGGPQDGRDAVDLAGASELLRSGYGGLDARLCFETVVAELSLKFINLPVDEIDREITDAQRRVCECLGLDVSALWQWSGASPGCLELTHLYRVEDGPPTPASMNAREYFPWCLEQLLERQTIAVSSLDRLPPAAARDRETWMQYGIRTTLTIPLSAGGGPLIGALSFHDMQHERVWPELLVERLRLVAQILANALLRKRADQALWESEERLSLATAAAGVGVWLWDIARDEVWATPQWRDLFGFPPEAVLHYADVMERIHPQDRERVEVAVRRAIHEQIDYVGEYRIVLPAGGERWIAARGRFRAGADAEQARMLGASVDITERKAVEQALEDRLRFERLLTELSATFINQPPDQIDGVIDEGLRRLLGALGNDRSSLAEFDAETGHVLITHSCAVAGIEPFQTGIFADEHVPWYVDAVRQGKTVVIRRTPEDFPPEAAKERAICVAHGIKSTMAVPLIVSGSILGVISFSFLRRYCDWSSDVVARLQVIGEIFANALARKRSDEVIRATLVENERLRERLEQENVYLREQVTVKHQHGRIIGQSQVLRRVLADAERVAVTDTPILLLGETGTGKELLAQTIHELSARKARPMVIVNCASLPATLIESELFGREAGAYTGAASAQVGRFNVADGSTLFLDEIGEFPVELQAKLLRVLQDGRFERLGSPRTVTVDVRIIAATNRDLERAVRDGQFRADLYHRLNVFPIRLPPLRERPEDIPELVWAFVEVLGRRMGKKITCIPRKTLDQLQRYSWPGNVRELSNIVERAMILTSGSKLNLELPTVTAHLIAPSMTLEESQRAHILRVLHETRWRVRGPQGAAEILAIKPTTLETRMAKLGIKRPK